MGRRERQKICKDLNCNKLDGMKTTESCPDIQQCKKLYETIQVMNFQVTRWPKYLPLLPTCLRREQTVPSTWGWKTATLERAVKPWSWTSSWTTGCKAIWRFSQMPTCLHPVDRSFHRKAANWCSTSERTSHGTICTHPMTWSSPK